MRVESFPTFATSVSEFINLPYIIRMKYQEVEAITPRLKQAAVRGLLMRFAQRIVRCQVANTEMRDIVKGISRFEFAVLCAFTKS